MLDSLVGLETLPSICPIYMALGCQNLRIEQTPGQVIILAVMNKRSMLIRLSNSVADLSSALGDDLDLTDEDCLFIENHLLMLQMAYTEWKSRNVEKTPGSDLVTSPGRNSRLRRVR